MAGWDIDHAITAKREGRLGLMWAYGASTVLGLAVLIVLPAGWTGVGLILVGLLIGVSVLIEYYKPNKVHEWLERCVWGVGNGSEYRTVGESMRELEVAIQG